MSGRACRTKPIHPSRFEASIAPACNATLLPRRSRIPPAPTAPCPPPVKRHLFTAATTPLLSSPLLLAAKLSKPWNSSTSKKHLSLSLYIHGASSKPSYKYTAPRCLCGAPLSLYRLQCVVVSSLSSILSPSTAPFLLSSSSPSPSCCCCFFFFYLLLVARRKILASIDKLSLLPYHGHGHLAPLSMAQLLPRPPLLVLILLRCLFIDHMCVCSWSFFGVSAVLMRWYVCVFVQVKWRRRRGARRPSWPR